GRSEAHGGQGGKGCLAIQRQLMVSESIASHVRPLQPSVRNLRVWRRIGGAGFWAVLGLTIFVISTLPLLYTVNIAFLQETRFGLSSVRSLEAVIDLFTSASYLKSLAVTLQIATLVTALSMFFGVVMALLIGRFALPAKGKLDILVI